MLDDWLRGHAVPPELVSPAGSGRSDGVVRGPDDTASPRSDFPSRHFSVPASRFPASSNRFRIVISFLTHFTEAVRPSEFAAYRPLGIEVRNAEVQEAARKGVATDVLAWNFE